MEATAVICNVRELCSHVDLGIYHKVVKEDQDTFNQNYFLEFRHGIKGKVTIKEVPHEVLEECETREMLNILVTPYHAFGKEYKICMQDDTFGESPLETIEDVRRFLSDGYSEDNLIKKDTLKIPVYTISKYITGAVAKREITPQLFKGYFNHKQFVRHPERALTKTQGFGQDYIALKWSPLGRNGQN